VNTPTELQGLTAQNLRQLLDVSNCLTRVQESIDAARYACKRADGLPGAVELLAVLDRVALEIDASHPADRLIARKPNGQRA